jgi:hypothetical protein
MLKKAVSEPAGGRAHIQADVFGCINTENINGVSELDPPAADISRRRFTVDDDGISVDLHAGFVGPLIINQNLSRHDQ